MNTTLLRFWQSLLVAVLIAVSATAHADDYDYYIVGELSGNVPPKQENAEYYENWLLDVIYPYIGEGCKIMEVPAGKLSFYLVDGLDENATCYGAGGAVTFDEGGTCKMELVADSSAPFIVEDWTGGRVIIGTDGNEIVISKLDSKIYLAKWSYYDEYGNSDNSPNPIIENGEYYADWVLNETSEGSGIYKGSFYINQSIWGDIAIAFFDRLTTDGLGWSTSLFANKIGIDKDMTPVLFDSTGVAKFDINIGDDQNSGAIALRHWRGGEIEFIVNLNDMTVTIDGGENANKYLYLMGAADTELAPIPENAEAYADWAIVELMTPGIYGGIFYIPADKFDVCIFPPFTEAGWDAQAFYAGANDVDLLSEIKYGNNVAVQMNFMKNGGRWIVENWDGGDVTVKVNLNNNTVEFTSSLFGSVIYVVGLFTGWVEPYFYNSEYYKDYVLEETAPGTGVYEHTFEIPAGEAEFRFYKDLTGWNGGASFGCMVEDYPTEFTMTDGVFFGSIQRGKGSWYFPDWDGGRMKMTVDLNYGGGVTFRDMDNSGIEGVELTPISIVPGVGCVTVSGADSVVIYNTMGVQVANETIVGDAVTIQLPAGLYIVNGVKVIVK